MARRGTRAVRSWSWAALFAFGAALFGASIAQEDPADAPRGVILTLDGAVTPASAGYLAREIAEASDAGLDLVVVEIDTPGGLVDSTHTIVQAILASKTPVATYVYPQGARSASAGLYIMYAAHVSAMAPSTNTGAATPVEIGGGPPSDDSPFGTDPTPDEEAGGAPESPDATEGGAEAEPADGARDAAPESLVDDAIDRLEEIRPRPDADSSPLSSNDALRAKVINDAVAYIRALAEERGRNADWAERAVREAVSVPAREALALGAVDYVAEDLEDLLAQMDGKVVKTADGDKTVRSKGADLDRVAPSFLERILGFIADPNVAVILMSLATTGLIIEMWNPGSVFPGVFGLVCLVLGLYAFQVLPFNWLGVALLIVGVLCITLEAYTPTFGLVGLAGLLLFAFGLFVIFPEGFRVSTAVIGTMVAAVGGVLALVLVAVVGSRSHGPLIGAEAIKRREGVVDDWDGKEGHVIVEGERWRARSDKPLKKGERIKVVEVDGLVLVVRQAKGPGLLGGLVPNEA